LPDFSYSDAVLSIGALGAAAYGLVDASKVLRGGLSQPGFGFILTEIEKFRPALNVVGADAAITTLRSIWLNGVSLDDQKAKAKAMIHMGINASDADALADVIGLGGSAKNAFKAAAQKLDLGAASSGQPALTQTDLDVIGRFDAILSARLDAAYERADQVYRNSAKAAACVIAVILALIGDYSLSGDAGAPAVPWGLAVLAGLIATPLAPVAKDVASSIQTASKAFSIFKR